MVEPESGVSAELAEAELQAVLASSAFVRSPRLARLLKYLCTKLLAGEARQIKEYNIGVEVLERPSTFDPASDAGARVEVHRLRKRLQDYYETEGASRKVRILIPVGHYVPSFIVNSANGAEPEAIAPPLAALETVPSARAPEPPVRTAVNRGSSRRWPWAVVAGLLVASAAFAWFRFDRRNAGANAAHGGVIADTLPSLRRLPGAAFPANALRIACGRKLSYTDRWGQAWGEDRFFQGGTPFDLPKGAVARASDPRLFERGRVGDFSYHIPLPPGVYELRLYFVEPSFGPGTREGGGEYSRIFDVDANGKRLLAGFDIYSDAFGAGIADTRVFKNMAPGPDGLLHLAFQSHRAQALVNAIELVAAHPHRLNPIRIVCQENFLTDASGKVWTPDNYYFGGQLASHPAQLSGATDPDLYVRERFGHFDYALPVDEGVYQLSLYMAEEYWGPGNQGGGIGSRIFNVFCNGATLLRNYDMLREGPPSRSIVKAFHGLTPNAQGKLNLSFEPVHDYASIYALEVVDESP